MFALTSTCPYYSIPVWHARFALLPTALLWCLEKHAVCFNGNWIWSDRMFFHQKSSGGLFPVCIPCVFRFVMQAHRQPIHFSNTVCLERCQQHSKVLRCLQVLGQSQSKKVLEENWGAGGSQFCCPIHLHTPTKAHLATVSNNATWWWSISNENLSL